MGEDSSLWEEDLSLWRMTLLHSERRILPSGRSLFNFGKSFLHSGKEDLSLEVTPSPKVKPRSSAHLIFVPFPPHISDVFHVVFMLSSQCDAPCWIVWHLLHM